MGPTQDSYVQVQPLGGFDKPLTYRNNFHGKESIEPGSLVTIPLGKRKITGIVWAFEQNIAKPKFKVHNILSVIQATPVLTSELMQLASWISRYYSCSMEACLEAMIPTPVREGMKSKSRRLLFLEKDKLAQLDISTRATSQKKIISFLEKQSQPVNLKLLQEKTSASSATINNLVKKGLIRETQERIERVAYEDDFLDSAETVDHTIELTEEQKVAATEISLDLNKKTFHTRLLCGVTGSGKTEVYFEAMDLALAGGGGVLFLVPEVALLPKLSHD